VGYNAIGVIDGDVVDEAAVSFAERYPGQGNIYGIEVGRWQDPTYGPNGPRELRGGEFLEENLCRDGDLRLLHWQCTPEFVCITHSSVHHLQLANAYLPVYS